MGCLLKWLENYLKSEGYEVFGRNRKKTVMGFKYSQEDKPLFSIKVSKKSGLYSMDFTDYRDNPKGELEYIVTPYLADIIDFLKGYNKRRFQKLCEARQKI